MEQPERESVRLKRFERTVVEGLDRELRHALRQAACSIDRNVDDLGVAFGASYLDELMEWLQGIKDEVSKAEQGKQIGQTAVH